MRHMVAFELSGSEAALTQVTPVPDGTVNIQGNFIRVPTGMANIGMAAASINSATATLRGQLNSPSLRAMVPVDISPIKNGLVFGSQPPWVNMYDNPIPLIELESLEYDVQNGAAVMNRAIVEFVDGANKPVSGKIYTTRATAAASLATATWVNSTLTFSSVLPAGNYAVVGMRAWSANGVAARIFFVGGTWRPGVLMNNTLTDVEREVIRMGRLGNWGIFANTTPPTVDFLGVTDTAQELVLDLIKQ